MSNHKEFRNGKYVRVADRKKETTPVELKPVKEEPTPVESKAKQEVKQPKQSITQNRDYSKLPSYGEKVKQAFIDLIKEKMNIDMSTARDRQFDNNRQFNIDVRDLGGGDVTKGEHIIGNIQNYVNRYHSGGKELEVSIARNGAYRYAIWVHHNKIK